MSRLRMPLFMLVVLAMLVTACAAPVPQPAAAPTTAAPTAAAAAPTTGAAPAAAGANVLKIGAALALTGSVSKEGGNVRDGYIYWRDWINDHGGLDIGGQKYNVELVMYDDKSDAQTGAQLTEKLITEDKVDFLFGPYSSGITSATSAIGEKYKVLTMAPQANADSIYERGFKYVFSVLPPASRYLKGIIDMALAQTPQPKTIAVLMRDDAFGIAGGEGAASYATEKGLNVVYKEKFSTTTNDVSSLLTQVKAANPDILLAVTLYQDAVLITRQSKDLQVCPKLMGFTAGTSIPDFSKELGQDAEYIYGSEWWLPILQWKDAEYGSAPEFAKAFEAKFGYVPGYHAASGAAAGRLLEVALKTAGSKDVDKVRAALLDPGPGETFWGPTGWNEQGKNIEGTSIPIQIQQGQVTAVWPEATRQKAPIYPMPCWNAR